MASCERSRQAPVTLLLGLVSLLAILGTSIADESGCAVNYDDPAPTCGGGEEEKTLGGGGAKQVGKAATRLSVGEPTCVTEPGVDYPGTQRVGESERIVYSMNGGGAEAHLLNDEKSRR
jgi:hypothetical protein